MTMRAAGEGLVTRLTSGERTPSHQQKPTPASIASYIANGPTATPLQLSLRLEVSVESFLKTLFKNSGWRPRSVSTSGEQIDGRFLLGSDTYLLEANGRTDHRASTTFNIPRRSRKKASLGTGPAHSYSGFSEDGLHAFGRGEA